ncbi:HAD family hydrolase [Vibrio hepatarius]|uniref:HAD family hydrolase n=1 Tax=Vibrio hepatarius TaxID=171383 RepID=UPI00142DBE3F|nr:HAD family hydrolase [Vibrio hepatarius]NIY85185.1 HAD family hydrolase [Vibrio hepatarius]
MKLVIFDCDGTLVDSELLCNLALEHQLSDLGLKCSADELLAKYRGGKLASIISSLENEFSMIFPKSFESEYRSKVNELFDKELVATDGIQDVLDSLTIPFCIASSAPRAKIERALNVTGLSKYFENNIFSSYEVGSWKPEPDLFLHAASTMKVKPEYCAVVEDSLLGLEAANQAKMKSIYYAPEETKVCGLADVQIRHMSELIKHIT